MIVATCADADLAIVLVLMLAVAMLGGYASVCRWLDAIDRRPEDEREIDLYPWREDDNQVGCSHVVP